MTARHEVRLIESDAKPRTARAFCVLDGCDWWWDGVGHYPSIADAHEALNGPTAPAVRCARIENPGVWPYAKRCEAVADRIDREGEWVCPDHAAEPGGWYCQAPLCGGQRFESASAAVAHERAAHAGITTVREAPRCICWKGESTEGVLEDCPIHGIAGREGDR